VEKLPFNCIGRIDPSLFGSHEPESSYDIAFYKVNLNNVSIILVSGENSFSSKYLDDNVVYNPDTFAGKMCLYSIGMRYYAEYLIQHRTESLPDIIHMHDYHVVISFIGIKQALIKKGLDVPSIITIHLLTWPRFDLSYYRACGIDDSPIKILLPAGFRLLTIKEILALCEEQVKTPLEYKAPSIEKVGAIVSDLVTTVSQSYLKTDIIPKLGQDLISFKTDFVWDGCDWNYDDIYKSVIQVIDPEIRRILNITNDIEITREAMKRYLLTYKIGNLSQSPLINSKKVLDAINEISNGNPFVKNGNIKAFNDSGPLVITTGRITPQKGFEVILDAIPEVIKTIPNAKFLLLILPTDYNLDEIKTYAKFVKLYPDNLRIIFGVASDIFYLAHIAADAYAALSRWEPFGIIALEAMASKLPIIATKVGGLQESIIDLRQDPENGTGVLIEKDNPSQFANALISIFKLAEIAEKVKKTGSIYEVDTLLMANQIPDGVIKSRVLLKANYYDKMKENCYNRVKNNFRWSIVSKKLIALYSKIKNLQSRC
jgi:starch synthase